MFCAQVKTADLAELLSTSKKCGDQSIGTENRKLGWKTKARTWNSIVEVRARNYKNKDEDAKKLFGTKK